jgi:DNA mismatch repair protein MutS2
MLGKLDLAFAKAEFARQYECCLPEFAPGRDLVLEGVRHPLLEQALRAQKRRPVPISVELRAPKTLMIISGPNAGGKTVALKTLGLAALMAQSGLPVVAEAARLPIFQRVLADIGDQQSIAANLSTFSAHVTNIQTMAETAGKEDLVLLDELGASTEPNEGAALAIAILEHFRARGPLTVVTTHHSRLKAYAAESSEAVNAAMEFDEVTLQPTYRLLCGLPGKSSALEIAARLGLEPSIVEKARALLHPADAEAARLLAELHANRAEFERGLLLLEQQRRELEARKAELDKKFQAERATRLRELDARLEETLREFEGKWEAALAKLREGAETIKLAKSAERQSASLKKEVREDWNAQVLESLGFSPSEEGSIVRVEPAVGDWVRLEGFATPALVTALLDADHVEVELGRMRMRAHKQDLRVLTSSIPPIDSAPASRAVAFPHLGPAEAVSAEINVIGTTAEEARARVDKFLDQAFLEGRFRLRIVHGHGKGILRKSLHEMFATHPHVEKYYAAPPQEGGAGATIVELKL